MAADPNCSLTQGVSDEQSEAHDDAEDTEKVGDAIIGCGILSSAPPDPASLVF